MKHGWRLLLTLSSLCALALSSAAPAQGSTQGDAIVQQAAKWAGTQYCWDGGDINGPTRGTPDPTDGGYQCASGTTGFDCTGLTLYAVYQVTGIVLPHGTGQDSSPGGTAVAEADLQPGDLVFFGPSLANYTHSGVYAGVINGKPSFWSAVTEGTGVALESMAWEEAASAFVGGTRYWSGSGSGGGDLTNGTLVSYQGNVYRMAGGAPLYVSDWAAIGGPKPTIALSDAQWASLAPYPADGTLLGASGGGVYRVAGGAPLYVSNWAASRWSAAERRDRSVGRR